MKKLQEKVDLGKTEVIFKQQKNKINRFQSPNHLGFRFLENKHFESLFFFFYHLKKSYKWYSE